jgi:hypothetical protein
MTGPDKYDAAPVLALVPTISFGLNNEKNRNLDSKY